MFTPKKKGFVPNPRNGNKIAEKGKAIASLAIGERVPPHLGRKSDVVGGFEAADRRGSKEGAQLDQSLMEKQDRDALSQKIFKLEKELYDYQHNMGLLLLEKQKWTSNYEKVSQALTEAQGLLAIAEVEKREETLRKVLEKEKQCVDGVKIPKLHDKSNAKLVLEKHQFGDKIKKERVDHDEKQLQLHKEVENLKVAEDKKREIQLLQSELVQEKDRCVKEREALKQDKERYEREWKVLDEKKTEIAGALNEVNEEKEKLAKLKLSHEERLKNENLIAHDYIQRELKGLRVKKAAFEARMERERLLLSGKSETEVDHEFELQKVEQMEEKNLLEKEREAMKEKRVMVEKDIQEVAARKQYLEGQQLELRKDIDKLSVLVVKFKDQSKGFEEVIEKVKKCKNCGDYVNDFALSHLQLLQEMGNALGPEVPEAPVHSESKSVHLKRRVNPRRGGRRANSVVEKDTQVILGKASEPSEQEPESQVPGENHKRPRRGVRKENSEKAVVEDTEVLLGKTMEPSTVIDKGSRRGSLHVDQGPVAAELASEQDPSEPSVVAIRSRKRRQTVSHESQVPEENRYNLRRRKV